ncbi:hypothetical protein GQ55_3G137800 [Panicum hallii var. hallii]|uniref:Uncharacterized protein n=1 Tax=Panicum hallii var. hallii TaxID=1504633 RepID=A0A2T7E983_9POAL|nr:hypothetical protein GQ55_3G137800 [Panicum hallii var. hallii]
MENSITQILSLANRQWVASHCHVLVLFERKRLVREALDRRCALAAWSAKESAIRLQIPGGAVVSASDLQPPAATPRPRETKGRATQKEKHRRSKRDATHGVRRRAPRHCRGL